MKLPIIIILFVLLLPVLLVGCAPATVMPPAPTDAAVAPVYTLRPVLPFIPDCSTASPAAPVPLAPRGRAVVDSLTPSLTWDYSTAGCTPAHFTIELREQAEEVGSSAPVLLPGSAASFPVTPPLKPGTAYLWRVRAMSGSSLSSLDGAPGDLGQGWALFFTGPMCADAALLPPVLDAPAEGDYVSAPAALALRWHSAEACLPYNYRPELAADAAFTTVLKSWLGSGPTPPVWSPLMELTDCTVYYWRVGSVPSDGGSVVFSEARSFYVDQSGSCPLRPVSGSRPTSTHGLLPPGSPPGPTVPTETPQVFNCAQVMDPGSCQQASSLCQWVQDGQHPNGACVNR